MSALQFDGYEEMTVSEFQNKVWELTDTNEHRSLLERFSLDATLYEQKDSNALASFLFYTLEPLSSEKWQTRDFRGGTTTNYPGAVDNASLEFVYSLTVHIADKQTLTVGERDEHIGNMLRGIENFWNRTDMEEMLHMTNDDMVRKLQEIASEYSDADITITIREDSVWFEKMDEQSKVFD